MSEDFFMWVFLGPHFSDIFVKTEIESDVVCTSDLARAHFKNYQSKNILKIT